MDCPVCCDKRATSTDSAGGEVEVECPRCGRFRYTTQAWEKLNSAPSEKRVLVCGWLWEQTRFGSVPTIGNNVDMLLSSAPLPFLEKAKRLLIHLSTQSMRTVYDLSSLRLDSMLETLIHDDVDFVHDFLQQQGWVQALGGLWFVTGPGFLKADEWKQGAATSSQAFVAMWFSDDMESAWKDGLHKGVSDAGYKPLRIDNKEHANKICDEIISEIRRSRFLVADYTGHRGGVYYEAGYAAGRNLPVILTCKKDEIAGLHFDVRQYNCIDWESADELARRLQVRIEAVIGDGPLKQK
jgi:nucleoside 2-deoxyribosyltransferase